MIRNIIAGMYLDENKGKYRKYRENLYGKIQVALKKKRYNDALAMIGACSRMMYDWNQEYASEFLESALEKSTSLICDWKEIKFDEDVILVYDAFGIDNRGLMQIYLNALCNIKPLIYITYSDKNIPEIKEILKNNCGKIEFVDSSANYEKQIQDLWSIICKYKPKNAFLYTTPWDVIGITVFNHLKGRCNRYQINLTDSEFWLGLNSFDKCIEFRDYGAYISNHYRRIEKDKIVKIPFYPQINEKKQFAGYPFEKKDMKVMFSGGSIRKTQGADGQFYSMIRTILRNSDNVLFWYASNGVCEDLIRLMDEFPGRVYHTKERNDLYQIYKHSDIFLNTYPISGGLMLQYSVSAGVIPFTLKYDDEATGILLNEVENYFLYDTEEALCSAVKKVLSDDKVYNELKDKLKNAIITPEDFKRQLELLVDGRQLEHEIVYKAVDVEKFQMTYLERNNYLTYAANISTYKKCFRYLPVEVFIGLLYRIIRKVRSRKNASD